MDFYITFKIDIHLGPVNESQHGTVGYMPGQSEVRLIAPVIRLNNFKFTIRGINSTLVNRNIHIESRIDNRHAGAYREPVIYLEANRRGDTDCTQFGQSRGITAGKAVTVIYTTTHKTCR